MGNTFWLERHHWRSFAEYEAELESTLRNRRMIVLCVYALERCTPDDVLDVIQQHQFTLARRRGAWEHLEGSELKRAHDEFSLQLLQFGIATRHGFNGRDPLELVSANPYAFSMILMDVPMPVMDGQETTRRLRLQERFENTPIIALTALAMPGDRERCLQAGANEYMSQLVNLKSLARTIQQLM
jgi:CheY-like chemotaxis protein